MSLNWNNGYTMAKLADFLRIVKKIIGLVRNDGWNFDCFVVGVGYSSRC